MSTENSTGPWLKQETSFMLECAAVGYEIALLENAVKAKRPMAMFGCAGTGSLNDLKQYSADLKQFLAESASSVKP